MSRAPVWFVAATLAVLGWGAPSSAQEAEPEVEGAARLSRWSGLEEWASSVVDIEGRWRGPRVPWPAPSERPDPNTETVTLASLTLPLTVHGHGASEARAARALEGLEMAFLALELEGWPVPPTDGGRAGTSGFDLYLSADESFLDAPPELPTERAATERYVRVGTDAPLFFADTDRATAFAEVAAAIPDDRILACAFQAFAEAALLSSDVAEAPSVRRGLAVYLTERFTGQLGCDERRVITQQIEPERGYLAHDPESGEGGVVFLATLAHRHDRGAGTFLSALWNGTRQWTRDGGEPYALPDFWWVIGMALTRADDDLLRFVRQLGVARYFTGARRGGSRFRWLDRLPDEATVPVFLESRWERLPRSLRYDREVEPYGSAYASIDVSAAPPGSHLRVWLEAEFGVVWSLGAVRLDAAGRDQSHSFAPARNVPRAYLPVELLPGTQTVVLVVTNLGARALDADEVDDNARSFRLVVDRPAD